MSKPAYVLFSAMLCTLIGCAPGGSGSGGGGGSGGDPGTRDGGVEPGERGEPSDEVRLIFEEALAFCRQTLGGAERELAEACAPSDQWADALLFAVQSHTEALSRVPGLPGRNAPAEVTLGVDGVEFTDDLIRLLPCNNNPSAPPDCADDMSCPPPLNAFALGRVAFTLDPLLFAFVEGAAWWGALTLEAGGDPDAVDRQQLIAGLGEIFYANSLGQPFTVVTAADTARLFEEDPFTDALGTGAMLFLVFHELGHSNLNHALVNHTVKYGIVRAAEDAGIEPTEQQIAELQAELLKVKVATETQADIYAATLLDALGFDSRGPTLFTGGMAAYTLRAGQCSPDLDPDALYACIVQNHPNASHPPLDVRTELVQRIMDQDEDLTGMLTAESLFE